MTETGKVESNHKGRTPPREARDRLAFAIDTPELGAARAWVRRLAPHIGVFKVGLELFTAVGPEALAAVHEAGAASFLDLKLHDIPATMARAARVAAGHGVRYLTVHAAAGPAALKATQEAVSRTDTILVAVTVLTSLDGDTLSAVGLPADPKVLAERLGHLAKEAGIGALVTSPKECAHLRKALGPDMRLIVPGIRPIGADAGDQRRIATPTEALRSGADVLVVGRPIRDAADPETVAQDLVTEIARA